ncbi:MAG: hypothetical protein K5989_05230 [Lachnospiraceae bacterium]|nr:hypothetical protein [Lachnospiraceae bacterium]
MIRKNFQVAILTAAAMSLGLTACGGGAASKPAEVASEAAVADKSIQEKAESEASTEPETASSAEAEDTAAEKGLEDAGFYELYEYEANGTVVNRDTLETAGMGETSLDLKDDGTGTMVLYTESVDLTWTPGVIKAYGTTNYTYEIEGDKLILDMVGVKYTFVKADGGAASATAKAGEGGEANESSEATESTEAATEDAGTEASEAAGDDGAAVPDGVPNGTGIVSEEKVQKGYVWMSKVAKDIYHTTYEELADYFGVDGEFEKEEYSDHMKVNKRYYKWISEDDKNHFIYVNFEEEEPGVFTVSGYNSSGFSASDAEKAYLEQVQAEAREADKAAAANMAMKDFSVDIYPFAGKDEHVTLNMQIPESGWAYDEKKDHLVENEDVGAFGAGFIQFTVDEKVEDFDFYKDKFKNYKEIEDRQIGGVTMKGRTYEYIGYEWTEYIAQLNDKQAFSIGIVRVDISEGTAGDRILNSIKIK